MVLGPTGNVDQLQRDVGGANKTETTKVGKYWIGSGTTNKSTIEGGGQKKESKKKKSNAENQEVQRERQQVMPLVYARTSQPAQQLASNISSGSNSSDQLPAAVSPSEIACQLASQPQPRQQASICTSPSRTSALSTSTSLVHVWINILCLNEGLKVNRPRGVLRVHFRKAEFCNPSEKAFGLQTNNRAEAMACLRVLQHVPRLKDPHVQKYSQWLNDIGRKINQYHARQRCTSTREKLVQCNIWALVYDILQHRTGQTLWSPQYGHNKCSFNDKGDNTPTAAEAMCTVKADGTFGFLGDQLC